MRLCEWDRTESRFSYRLCAIYNIGRDATISSGSKQSRLDLSIDVNFFVGQQASYSAKSVCIGKKGGLSLGR